MLLHQAERHKRSAELDGFNKELSDGRAEGWCMLEKRVACGGYEEAGAMGGGAATDRSNASTISDAEWPEELHVGY